MVSGVLLSLALASAASAQPEADLVRARKLYSQGLTQEAAGDWAGALASFEDVARIKATPQVRFHLARCKEHLGRFNEALGGYRISEYEAEKAGPKEQALVEEVRKAREALEEKIPKVTIVRGKGAEAIKIELDGVVLGDTQIGQPITLDPGPHVLTGIQAQGKSFKKTLNIAEGDAIRVVLDAPEESVEPAPAPQRSDAPAPKATPAPEAPVKDTPPAPSTPSAAPWVVGGLGVASLALSAVFYSMRVKAEDDLKSNCIGSVCPESMEETERNGKTYAALTGVTFGLGIVGVGAGALMLMTRSRPTPAAPPAATLRVHERGASLSFGGRF